MSKLRSPNNAAQTTKLPGTLPGIRKTSAVRIRILKGFVNGGRKALKNERLRSLPGFVSVSRIVLPVIILPLILKSSSIRIRILEGFVYCGRKGIIIGIQPSCWVSGVWYLTSQHQPLPLPQPLPQLMRCLFVPGIFMNFLSTLNAQRSTLNAQLLP
jgi:hypothetical protein